MERKNSFSIRETQSNKRSLKCPRENGGPTRKGESRGINGPVMQTLGKSLARCLKKGEANFLSKNVRKGRKPLYRNLELKATVFLKGGGGGSDYVLEKALQRSMRRGKKRGISLLERQNSNRKGERRCRQRKKKRGEKNLLRQGAISASPGKKRKNRNRDRPLRCY